MLASGCKNAAVLSALSIDRTTLTKWQVLPEFQSCLQDLADIQRDEVRRSLRQASSEIADNLRSAIASISELIRDEELQARDRIAACNIAVRMAERMMDISTDTEPASSGADFDEAKLKAIRENLYGIVPVNEPSASA